MRVIVLGATGRQGGATARALREAGHDVVALTRQSSSPAAQALSAIGVQVAEGDMEDRPRLQALMAEADAAFAVTAPFRPNYDDAELRQGRAVADAAYRAGLGHLVFSSAAFSPSMNYGHKIVTENYLMNLGLPYTVLVPSMFMENLIAPFNRGPLRHGVYAMAARPATRYPYVSCRDIGDAAAHVIMNRERFLGAKLPLVGDELTGPAIASMLSIRLGTPIRYEQVPLERIKVPDQRDSIEYWEQHGMGLSQADARQQLPGISWESMSHWMDRQDWNKALAPV
jgi:uncharacterized protein YbjT (DUF2867 family)